MKALLLQLERALWGRSPLRWLVLGLDRLVRRGLWLWGRMRFAALVPQRGQGCVCHWNADLKYPERLSLGDGVVIGTNVSIGAHSPVYIGHRVRLSREVMIETAGLDFSALQPPYTHTSAPIVIEEGVWIGARALVLGGVTIGAHSVVAAGAVVTRSCPPRSVLGGVPARVLSSIDELSAKESRA